MVSQAPLFSVDSTLMDLIAHVRRSQIGQNAVGDKQRTKIRVLANFSTQYLVTAMEASLAHRGMSVIVDETAYDQWELVLSAAAEQTPADYTLLLLSTSKLILTARAADPEHFANYLLDRINAYQAVVGGRVIVSLPESLREGVDQSLVFFTWVREIRQAMQSRLSDVCILFDMDVLVREFGFQRWSAPKFYMSSKLPCHPNCFPAVGAALGDLIWSLALRPTRLVVVDLDNTLWDGEVGEVGWQGVGLDAAEGAYPHLLLQRMLLHLKQNGVLLAVASKNNEKAALEVFRNRPEMVLGVDDFSAMEINWLPKSQNIQAILTRLNLSATGVTFLDDSRLEREEIRARVPEVFVPELPDAQEDWLRFLVESKAFSLGDTREEDRGRVDMYKSEAMREELSRELGSYADFLRELQLTVVPELLGSGNLSRAHELVQKTNQFNLTNKRSTESELRAIANSDTHIAFVYRLADRYGSYGAVSVVIVAREPGQWVLHTWVMSCRAMGRQVELAVFEHLLSRLLPSDDMLVGVHVRSDKNSSLEGFLPSLGFASEGDSPELRLHLGSLGERRPPTVVRVDQ